MSYDKRPAGWCASGGVAWRYKRRVHEVLLFMWISAGLRNNGMHEEFRSKTRHTFVTFCRAFSQTSFPSAAYNVTRLSLSFKRVTGRNHNHAATNLRAGNNLF
jgi:hypothetical protein